METPTVERVQRAVGDQYTVERLFGRGGMGAVYLGRNRRLGSPVAIKVLPVPAAEGSDELARFAREARLAANLPHPNIVPVYAFDVRDELAFFVMPFVEGTSLAEYLLKQGRMELDDALQLIREVGGALAFAHEKGVVHRDIKPANILREEATGRWMVTDFGIARSAAPTDPTLTGSGVGMGTPAYMAPEQLYEAKDVDGRADLYSLAAVACEALTGTRTDTSQQAEDIGNAVRSARSDISRSVVRALVAGLAPRVDERPPSVADWLATLDITDPRLVGATGSWGRPRGSRWAVAGITVGGVLLAGVIGLWRWRAATPADEAPPTVAIAPFSVTGTIQGVDLSRELPRAFEEQLRWIPEYRVIGAAALARAAAQSGEGAESADELARLAAERFGADEVLFGSVALSEPNRVRIEVQVRESAGARTVRGAEREGVLDSLSILVSDLITETFAAQLASEQAGWSPSLPRGLAAVSAYFDGDRLLRAAAYGQATRQFEQVTTRDSAFAPAHFKRMLSEVLRAQPTRATNAIRSALDAVRRHRAGLDPTTAELLRAYELLLTDGDVEQAHEALRAIVAEYPGAVDAWFILGYIEFYLGGLFGVAPGAARFAFERAYELDPGFAAAVAQLALLAVLEEDQAAAERYFGEYLAIDSVSVWAELMRMADSLLYGGVRSALTVRGSFASRPSAALEMIAFGAGNMGVRLPDRLIARDAMRALADRATTAGDRRIAFRLQLASLLGNGRVASADSLHREGRRRNVPADELDSWLLLTAVTGIVQLGDEDQQQLAAARLLEAEELNPTRAWLAARWYRNRDAARARAARRRFTAAVDADPLNPLALSLRDDLAARDSLAAGDSTGALRSWARAAGRYRIEEVPFGLLGSLWPVHLDRARVAAASGDPGAVLAATASFANQVGYNDQVAWMVALPLRAAALDATGDPLGARQLREALVERLRDANGAGTAARERLERELGGG